MCVNLAMRLTMVDHKNANVVVYTGSVRRPLFFGRYNPDDRVAVAKATKEDFRKWTAYNEQVKNDLGIEFKFVYRGLQVSEHDEKWYGDTWHITGRRDFFLPFKQGVGHRHCFRYFIGEDRSVAAFVVPPSAMDILYCIRLENPHDETFEDWCYGLGYDTDSRKAEKIYRACIDQTMMFRRNYPEIDLDAYAPLDDF